MVLKQDKGWRMYIDYRTLNKTMVKIRYLLPRIDDLLDQLQHVMIFSKLDLKSRYHQVWIQKEDMKNILQNKISIVQMVGNAFWPMQCTDHLHATPERYATLILKISSSSTSTTFSSTSCETCWARAKGVWAPNETPTMAQLKKIWIQQKRPHLPWLHHWWRRIQIDLDTVKAIREWPKPRMVTEVRSFLGACQYLCKFIWNFSILATPLYSLTKAN